MLAAVGLSKSFETDTGDLTAVDDVSFSVSPGQVYGLLGPNGAGKTTTLRMILGLLPPDRGYAEVGGYRTDRSVSQVKSQLGFVSAGEGVYGWLTVREMLHYFADLYGVEYRRAGERIQRLADLLDITPLLDRRAGRLSTGQRQRVTLARGLIHDPPVMLLDEPTRGLDVVGSKTVFDYIAHLREEGKAVIVCTHRLEEAERLCDRFGMLHRGRLVREGNLAELQEQTGLPHLVDMFLDILRDRNTA